MKVCELKQIQPGIFEVQSTVECPAKIRTDTGVIIRLANSEQKEQYNYFDYEAQSYHSDVQQANVLFLQKLFLQDWKVRYVKIDENGCLQLYRPIRLVIIVSDAINGGVWALKAQDIITQKVPYYYVDTNYIINNDGSLFELYLRQFDTQDEETAAQQYVAAYAEQGTKLEYFENL